MVGVGLEKDIQRKIVASKRGGVQRQQKRDMNKEPSTTKMEKQRRAQRSHNKEMDGQWMQHTGGFAMAFDRETVARSTCGKRQMRGTDRTTEHARLDLLNKLDDVL